jgi:hypothetical protein
LVEDTILGQALVPPNIAAGAATNCLYTAKVFAVLVSQPEWARTDILVAFTKLLLKVTRIRVSYNPPEPGLDTIVTPVGTLQTYPRALTTELQ